MRICPYTQRDNRASAYLPLCAFAHTHMHAYAHMSTAEFAIPERTVKLLLRFLIALPPARVPAFGCPAETGSGAA